MFWVFFFSKYSTVEKAAEIVFAFKRRISREYDERRFRQEVLIAIYNVAPYIDREVRMYLADQLNVKSEYIRLPFGVSNFFQSVPDIRNTITQNKKPIKNPVVYFLMSRWRECLLDIARISFLEHKFFQNQQVFRKNTHSTDIIIKASSGGQWL